MNPLGSLGYVYIYVYNDLSIYTLALMHNIHPLYHVHIKYVTKSSHLHGSTCNEKS